MQEEPLSIIKLDASSRKAGAFKGEAIVNYCESLITQQMEASGSPAGCKVMRLNDFHPLYLIGILVYFANLLNLLSLNIITTSH